MTSVDGSLAQLALGTSTGAVARTRNPAAEVMRCYHCGEACPDQTFSKGERLFCCQGCLFVHDLLAENGLEQFYSLSRHPGARIRQPGPADKWSYLDEEQVQRQLLDFTDGECSRITLHIPVIHCVACVWLLENLFRLHPGVGKAQVTFPRREVSISFAPDRIKLSELVGLLASIGYEPQLTLGELTGKLKNPARHRQWLQVGIAGFAFGNIMLFTLPAYLGLDSLSGPLFRAVFGYLSLALAIPVLVYSASDYWRSALLSLRQRVLTLDVPITLGLAALYAQSAYEILSGRGGGYLDSLAGLVFFLLCGRAFQQKTQDRIVFDRDYKSFFPLAVTRRNGTREEFVAISNLQVGDRLLLRNGELIPADARLLSGQALIDYSFVTGEADPVSKQVGDYVYAGGQQVGSTIEVETLKPVSQSYLTGLWSHEAFQKTQADHLNTLTNRYSRRFTWIVVFVAVVAALFWVLRGDVTRGIKAFTSVLIVACPCALALAAPFTLGTAQRLLAQLGVFLKNALVLERLAQVDALVFDKTGTLTTAHTNTVSFWPASRRRALSTTCGIADSPAAAKVPECRSQPSLRDSIETGLQPGSAGLLSGVPSGQTGLETAMYNHPRRDWPSEDLRIGAELSELALSFQECRWVHSLTRHSIHPHCVRISEYVSREVEAGTSSETTRRVASAANTPEVSSFTEAAGQGISGQLDNHVLLLGSRAWLCESGIRVPELPNQIGSVSCLAIDGSFRGAFVLANALRPETERLVKELANTYELALLSGDNERDRERFKHLFGESGQLHFNQTPAEKLTFIKRLQATGKTVMMVGDGLNDAGALKQSDVGVAVVEKVGAFSPASDLILEAGQVPRLAAILAFARNTVRVVHFSFAISGLYNLIGISIAAAGVLSPIICAVLMPLSSFTVVLFACGATTVAAHRAGLSPRNIVPFAF